MIALLIIFIQYCSDPNMSDNGEITSSEWPLYKSQTRDYKIWDAETLFSSESLKTGPMRPKQCALYQWYLPKVEGKCTSNTEFG